MKLKDFLEVYTRATNQEQFRVDISGTDFHAYGQQDDFKRLEDCEVTKLRLDQGGDFSVFRVTIECDDLNKIRDSYTVQPKKE